MRCFNKPAFCVFGVLKEEERAMSITGKTLIDWVLKPGRWFPDAIEAAARGAVAEEEGSRAAPDRGAMT
jgi:hypothetical protein